MKLDLEQIRANRESGRPKSIKTYIHEHHLARLKHASDLAGVPMYQLLGQLIETYLPEVE
jgi:hypothetical protein